MRSQIYEDYKIQINNKTGEKTLLCHPHSQITLLRSSIFERTVEIT